MSRNGKTAAATTADAAAKNTADGAATDTHVERAEAAASGAQDAQQSTAAEAGNKGAKTGDEKAEIPVLFVRAVPEQGFRRCGYAFTREGFGIALDLLTKEQIETLKQEKNLVVQEGSVSADDLNDAEAAEVAG